MKIQLAIMGAVIVAGVIMFMPNTADLVPDVPDVFDSVRKDLGNVQKNTAYSVEDGVTNSLNSVNEKIDDLKGDSKEFLSKQKPDSIIPTILEETFFGKTKDESITSQESVSRTNSKSIGKSVSQVVPTVITTTPKTQTMSLETLSLVTEKQSDDSVMVKYEDVSGQTISVTVTMRNEEKILFTGEFFSSSFETIVPDAADTPHFIDMIVEHAEHGTISASAFNPAGNTDSKINDVFISS